MSAKLVNSANITIEDTLTKDTIKAKRNKVIKNIAKNLKIDGFRKGKVPNSIIESRFNDKITQDSEQEAIGELIEKSLKELDVAINRVIGTPLISRFDKNDDGISVALKVGLFPQVELGDYMESVPDINMESIGDEDVAKRLEEFAKQYGELIESNKESAELGDIVNIDFEGFIDGVAFDGGKAENYDLELGSKSFVDGFEDQIVGMQKSTGETIEITFPENYTSKNLASKKAEFHITLNRIQERKSSNIDDELAKKILPSNEKATLEDAKSFIKTQLENEAKHRIYNELKPKLADNLIEKIAFDVPENILEQETDIVFRNHLRGIPSDMLKELQQDPQKVKEKREGFRDEAHKSVKLTFIIDTIAKKDNISVSDNEVYQMIYYEAMISSQNPRDMLDFYEKNNMIPVVKMTILENKVLGTLLDKKLQAKTQTNNA